MSLYSTVYEALNRQIGLEIQSSNTYLQMASWSDFRELTGSAAFFYAQAEEERSHMRKIFDYILERGYEPVLQATPKVRTQYSDIQELFKVSYEQEKEVSKSIDEISHLAWEQKDLATFFFLQWFVEEQREEEETVRKILGKIDVIGIEGQGLYLFDKFVKSLVERKE